VGATGAGAKAGGFVLPLLVALLLCRTALAAGPARLLAAQMLEPRNGAAVATLDNGEVLIAVGKTARAP